MTQDKAILGRPGATTARLRRLFFEADARALAIAGMLVAGWCLTGVTLVPVENRAVYERLGVPVAVFGPGLHIRLPWPFGEVRQLDFGAVHRVEVAGRPGLSVLYRVGLADAQALDAAYGSADPDRLVLAVASQANATERGAAPATLQAAIQNGLDRENSGLEILGLAGAPQPKAGEGAERAADITALTIVAEARSKAAIERARAREHAAEAVAGARAKASETVADARSLLITFTADQAAHAANGKSFLLERYFANLTRAIGTSPKTIIDHRLNWPAAPELDLRPPPDVIAGGGAPGVGKGN
jgi:hypothetical protein